MLPSTPIYAGGPEFPRFQDLFCGKHCRGLEESRFFMRHKFFSIYFITVLFVSLNQAELNIVKTVFNGKCLWPLRKKHHKNLPTKTETGLKRNFLLLISFFLQVLLYFVQYKLWNRNLFITEYCLKCKTVIGKNSSEL